MGFQVKGCYVLFSCMIGKREITAVSVFGQLGFFLNDALEQCAQATATEKEAIQEAAPELHGRSPRSLRRRTAMLMQKAKGLPRASLEAAVVYLCHENVTDEPFRHMDLPQSL